MNKDFNKVTSRVKKTRAPGGESRRFNLQDGPTLLPQSFNMAMKCIFILSLQGKLQWSITSKNHDEFIINVKLWRVPNLMGLVDL